MGSWVGVWVLGKANPLQDDHLRTAVSSMGVTSTKKTLTEWRESCRGQDGWGLEHIVYKERLRKPGFGKIPQRQTVEQGPRPAGEINGDFHHLLRQAPDLAGGV